LNTSAIRYYERAGVLPDARAQAMREWVLAASGYTCRSFDVCAIFGDPATAPIEPDGAEPIAVQVRP
jgi:hypothetical protein